MRVARVLPAAFAAFGILAIPGGTHAQDGGAGPAVGSVVGAVFDSIRNAPLADAAVFLWETPHRTVTDALGRFRIEDVPPGDYSILFFHTRLGEIGASPGPTQISVGAGDSVSVELATPSMFTLVTSQCLHERRAEGTGVLAGWVGDASTRLSLPGAQVTLSWTEPGEREARRLDLLTEANGWYRTCQAPADVPLMAEAHFLDRHGLRREVSVTEAGFEEAGFLLDRLTNTKISGRLIDDVSDGPVGGAEVWLRGTDLRALTDSDGHFLFDDVQPGTYMLMTEHLAYGTKMDTLEVPPDVGLLVEMRLDTKPIEIAPLTVTVEAANEPRRARGGIHISAEQVEAARQSARDAADILRAQHIPGLVVDRQSTGRLCVGYAPGQVRMMFNNGCVPMMIFINDARASNNDLALMLPPDAIEEMIIYKPIEAGNLFGLGAGNGVLMIYTKGN